MATSIRADDSFIEKKLYQAIVRKDDVEVERILKTGFRQSDHETDKDNLLVNAADVGNVETVKLLLKYGWGLNSPGSKNQEGKTALHAAIMSKRMEAAKYLIKIGADVNTKDMFQKTPLHIAAENGLHEIVKNLVKKGIEINAQDSNGSTPLHYGSESLKTSKILLKNNADPNIRDQYGVSPLYLASRALSEDKNNWKRQSQTLSIMNLLKKHGAKLSSVEAFFSACYNENIGEMKKAIRTGIPIDSILDRTTCLIVAIKIKSFSLVRFLVESGADVNHDKLAATPLFFAVKTKRIDLVEYLIKRGADVNLHPQNGISPLKAVNLQMIETTQEICDLLLEHGAEK